MPVCSEGTSVIVVTVTVVMVLVQAVTKTVQGCLVTPPVGSVGAKTQSQSTQLVYVIIMF